MPFSSTSSDSTAHSKALVSNYNLLIPYFAPIFAYVAIVSLFSGLQTECNYALRIVVVSGIFVWAWHIYLPFTGPKDTFMSIGWGFLGGLLGTVLWISMLKPFVYNEATAWHQEAFYLRLLAASLLVPIFEETLMRGYIFRVAYQWSVERKRHNKHALYRVLHDQSINDVEPGAWSIPAILVSTIAFMVGHQVVEWPAAFLYGILMTILWIKRKDLISCIVAHATTNFTLGLYIYFTGHWELW